MPWKTLWIRCGPQPLGTEKHDPGQQVCPRELCPMEQSKSPADRAYRLIPSFIQCWFHPACLPSLHTPRPQDSLTRQLSCARPVNPAIIHLAEIPVIFRTLWKTRGLENAQPGHASMRRPFSDEHAGRYWQTYSYHRPPTPLSPFLSTGRKQDFGSQKT